MKEDLKHIPLEVGSFCTIGVGHPEQKSIMFGMLRGDSTWFGVALGIHSVGNVVEHIIEEGNIEEAAISKVGERFELSDWIMGEKMYQVNNRSLGISRIINK